MILMNEINFDSIFSGAPLPERLSLSRRALNSFKKIGGKGLAIIVSDEEWGPVVKYYYLKRSRIITKLLENKSLPVELSIAGKYAEEILMKDGSKLVISSYEVPSDKYKRKKTNYIVIEVSPDTNAEKLKPIMEKLKREIANVKNLNKGFLRKILINLLDKHGENS